MTESNEKGPRKGTFKYGVATLALFVLLFVPSCQGLEIVQTKLRLKEINALKARVASGEKVLWSEVETALQNAKVGIYPMEPNPHPEKEEPVRPGFIFRGGGFRPGFSLTEASIFGEVLVKDGYVTSFTSEYRWITL